MVHRLLELQPRQPTPMQLGPSRPPVVTTLPQQEAGKLLACSAQCVHRVEPGAHHDAITAPLVIDRAMPCWWWSGFIEEDQPRRIEARSLGLPGGARFGDVAGVHDFF